MRSRTPSTSTPRSTRSGTTLLDVERVAPCVPGAEVLEQTGDDAYKVAIKVKVGPMSMTYRGEVEIIERDPEDAPRGDEGARQGVARPGHRRRRVQMALTEDGGHTARHDRDRRAARGPRRGDGPRA